MANSFTNLALSNNAIRKSLESEEYGKKFLELWPTISTATDIASVTAFMYVARKSLQKIGRELSSIERLRIEAEIVSADTKFARFTQQEIDIFVDSSTKNPYAKKVMLGKYERQGPNCYVTRAGKEYSYFQLDDWDDLFSMIGQSNEEMWKINKSFIDNSKALKKEFYFSHDPSNADGFLLKEVDYLVTNYYGRIVKINDVLWKVEF